MAASEKDRITPYDLVFGPAVFAERFFPAIEREAVAAEVDAADPQRFLQLGQAGGLLRELVPEDAPAAATQQIGHLLFHAFHYWHAGRHVLAIQAPDVERVLAMRPAGDALPATTFPAGYVQLPRNLFWSAIEEGATPEAVDGFFWVSAGDARLETLLALGLRADRAGLSVAHMSFAAAHAAEPPGGAPFGNVLPGGELAGLQSVTTPAETLELARRCFALEVDAGGMDGHGNTVHRVRTMHG